MSGIAVICVKEPGATEPKITNAAFLINDQDELFEIEKIVRYASDKSRELGEAPREVWTAVMLALEDASHKPIWYSSIVVETEPLHWHQLLLFP